MVETLTSELRKKYRQKILTPVIIQSKNGKLDEVASMVSEYIKPNILSSGVAPKLGNGPFNNIMSKFQGSLTSFKKMPLFNMLAVPLFPNAIEELADTREVGKMYYDRQMWALNYPTVPEGGMYELPQGTKFTSTAWTKKLMGCDKANEMGFTGNGIKISVPDTGANRTHEAVRHNITVETMMRDKGQVKDKNGHGLWCCGCIGGKKTDDRVLNVPTEGMAPDVNLLSLKVLGYVAGTGFTSDIIEGMEYSYKQDADVVSMSLGGEATKDPAEDPECQVINRLTEEGLSFVVAGGNSGPDSGTIGSPGTCPNALTIGAYDPIKGGIADFSSRGPTPDGRTKPDVVAPGVMTHAPILGALDGSNDKRSQRYSPISGTSMATPHTAGLVGLMKECHRKLLGRDLPTSEIKEMMMKLGEDKDNENGWGFLTWDKYLKWLSTEYGKEEF